MEVEQRCCHPIDEQPEESLQPLAVEARLEKAERGKGLRTNGESRKRTPGFAPKGLVFLKSRRGLHLN